MRAIPTGSGARYATEQGRRPGMSLEWRSQGDTAMLVEAPLDDTRTAADERIVARCTRRR